MEIPVPVDAELVLSEFVEATLVRPTFAGKLVPVRNSIPNPRPSDEQFVLLVRTGGVMRDRVTDVPTLVVEGYARTKVRAYQLCAWSLAILHSLEGQAPGGHPVYTVSEFAGPGNLPDPLTGLARYTATVSVAIRAERVVTI